MSTFCQRWIPVLIVGLLAAALGAALGPFHPAPPQAAFESPQTPRAAERRCAECHADITDAYRTAPHAHAGAGDRRGRRPVRRPVVPSRRQRHRRSLQTPRRPPLRQLPRLRPRPAHRLDVRVRHARPNPADDLDGRHRRHVSRRTRCELVSRWNARRHTGYGGDPGLGGDSGPRSSSALGGSDQLLRLPLHVRPHGRRADSVRPDRTRRRLRGVTGTRSSTSTKWISASPQPSSVSPG